MEHLDSLDDTAKILKACNSWYFNDSGELCGSNTDWIGIEGALRAGGVKGDLLNRNGGVAAVIGAGGASRAAIYALWKRFCAKTIYVLNRDDKEVVRLVKDCRQMDCKLLHLKSVEDAAGLTIPALVIGSVPDFEAMSPEEKAVKAILTHFLSNGNGYFADFCYHPSPETRNIKLAESHGWQTIQGIEIVGHQVEALWKLWIDEERLAKLDRDGLWKIMRSAAGMDSKGRQALNAKLLDEHFGR